MFLFAQGGGWHEGLGQLLCSMQVLIKESVPGEQNPLSSAAVLAAFCLFPTKQDHLKEM